MFASIVLCLVTTAAPVPPQAVAVFPIKPVDVPGFDSSKLVKFSDLLDSVVGSHGIKTVARSDLQLAIRREQAESFKECYDESCQIELGKSVAAQKILGSTWSSFGDTCVLSVKLHDLKTELTEFSTNQEVACSEQGLMQGITNAGQELAAHYDGDPESKGVGRISAFSPKAQGKDIKNVQTDKRGYLFIKSDPLGAQVFINGEERGVTPYQVELMAGRYVVILTSGALYKPFRKNLKLMPSGIKLEAQMQANFGILRVESTPPGAEIHIDGEPTGQLTPHTFPKKKSGQYRVTVKHPLYFSVERTARLGRGQQELVAVPLKPNHGSLAVASEPSGVSIFIDGVDTGQRTPALIEKVGDGSHTVEVKDSTWSSQPQPLTVHRNARTSATFLLQGRFGILKAAATLRDREGVRPAEAKVLVDGKALEQTTPIEHKLLVGEHTVSLHIDGAEPIDKVVNIRENETTRVQGELSFLSEAERKSLQIKEQNLVLELSAEEEKNGRSFGRSAALWTGIGGGVAAIGGGVLLGLANGASGRADRATSVQDLESAVSFGEATELAGWSTLSAGGAALVSSLVLYLINREPSGPEFEDSEPW